MTLNLNWQFSIIGSQRRRFQGGSVKLGKIEHGFLSAIADHAIFGTKLSQLMEHFQVAIPELHDIEIIRI